MQWRNRVIGIIHCWRQLSRRYIWPHLLLGMVAASFGLPVAQTGELSSQPEASSSTSGRTTAGFDRQVIVLKKLTGYPEDGFRYWHARAICTVFRCLSLAFTSPSRLVFRQVLLPEMQKLALPDIRHWLRKYELPSLLAAGISQIRSNDTAHQHQAGLWLAQVQGIRAGPQIFS